MARPRLRGTVGPGQVAPPPARSGADRASVAAAEARRHPRPRNAVARKARGAGVGREAPQHEGISRRRTRPRCTTRQAHPENRRSARRASSGLPRPPGQAAPALQRARLRGRESRRGPSGDGAVPQDAVAWGAGGALRGRSCGRPTLRRHPCCARTIGDQRERVERAPRRAVLYPGARTQTPGRLLPPHTHPSLDRAVSLEREPRSGGRGERRRLGMAPLGKRSRARRTGPSPSYTSASPSLTASTPGSRCRARGPQRVGTR